MDKSQTQPQDAVYLGKALQSLLQTAFSQDNFIPFLNKCLHILASCPAVGQKARLAIVVRDRGGKPPKGVFLNFLAADRDRLMGGLNPARASRGRLFTAPVTLGNARAGKITVLFAAVPKSPATVEALLGLAAQFVSARFKSEKRDEELNFERDLSSSLKHIEELYLSFPGISLEEISRAVLDEARRLTGSPFGFAGNIDQVSGRLHVTSLTAEAWDNGATAQKPLVFDHFSGLWGWVLLKKKPLLTNSAPSDRRAAGLPHGHIKIERFLGVPALSGKKLLGMLALANPAGDYGPEDLEAAQKLARVYAMILQRKAAEDKQKEEDNRFKAIVSSTRDVIYTASLDGRLTYVSPRVDDYGYCAEELVGRHIMEMGHPEDREFLAMAFANAVKTGRTLPILPYRIKRKDGSYSYVEQKSGIVFHGGRPAYITGVIRDVTEQRQTERLLKEGEALMRMVFDTAKDAIFVKDMNGMYVKVNKACADLMNTTTEKMIGRSDSDYFPAEAAKSVFRTDSEVVRSGRTLSLNNLHPFPGGTRYVNIIKTPLKNAAGETIGLLGVARDITDLKRMETELALAHAAEAVSKVARPMAHDFNNALAAINGYATLIDDDLAASSPIKTEISRIIEAVKRAAELTSKFQDFARNPKIEDPGEAGDKKGESGK